MIGSLRGTLMAKQPPWLLVEVNGVGYEIEAPMSTCFAMPAIGQPVHLHTHLAVRDDAHLLFGFASLAERRLFRSLIKVSGVGAKLALAVLSGLSVADFERCVETGDSATLTRLPGVGKKTAQRLVMELRDGALAPSAELGPAPTDQAGIARRDAVSALIALGYRASEADRMVAVAAEQGANGSDELIRQSLKQVAGRA
ncbi:MAG: Holliday junction branch migration protein RuvA [Chromatiales bacterium]|nr:Holliday junction branch migration protein RuvA [Chromatiales bacterium]